MHTFRDYVRSGLFSGSARWLLPLLTLALFLLQSRQSLATHAMGADMTYVCLGGDDYKFYVTFYYDCVSPVVMPDSLEIDITSCVSPTPDPIYASADFFFNGLDTLFFGEEISPLCPADLPSSSCAGGPLPGSLVYVYSVEFTLPFACADWTIAFSINNRNNAIDNLVGPGGEPLYVEAHINNMGALCNSSPVFSQLPVTQICKEVPFSFNHGAFDPDGDSLAYTMIQPLSGPGMAIPYVTPPYSLALPVTTLTGVFGFDPLTGQLNFTPDAEQTCVITIEVDEYRDGVWIGSTMRDIQIIVGDCTVIPPAQLGGPTLPSGATVVDSNSLVSCPGETLNFTLTFTDADPLDTITATSNVGVVLPGATYSISGTNPVSLDVTWASSPADSGFYVFTVSLQDNGCPIPGVSVFAFDITMLSGIHASPDVTYCPGAPPVPLSVSGGGSVLWSPAAGLDDPTSPTPMASPLVTTTYVVTSDLGGVCTGEDSVTVYVDPTTLDLGPDQFACNFGGAQLDGTAIGDAPAGGFIYTWTPVTGLSDPSVPDPVADPALPTTYIVTTTSDNGCLITDSILISMDIESTSAGPDTTICPGESLQLFSTGGVAWNWEPGEPLSCDDCPNPFGSAPGSMLYTLAITKPNGCVDTQYVDVATFPVPDLDAGDDISLQFGQIANLDASAGFDVYSWFPPEGLSSSSVANPEASPEFSTLYTVTAEHSSGCIRSDSVLVVIVDYLVVLVPNAFTPNGDGLNDVFSFIDRGLGELADFSVFNRWGETVFQTSNPEIGWDGTWMGKPQEAASYVFIIRGTDRLGKAFNQTGTITLLR